MKNSDIENVILKKITGIVRNIFCKEKTSAESKNAGNTGDFDIENGILIKYRGTGEDVTIPEGVTHIGLSAFSGCGNLYSISIPGSVRSIGDGAFDSCSNLFRIVIPDGVTSIGKNAFIHCGSLRSVKIPNGLTRIGEMAFFGCYNLKSVELLRGAAHNDRWQFLNSIRSSGAPLPEGELSIGDGAFSGCSSLSNVKLPENMVRIGKRAFYNCISLSTVKIPEEVRFVGDGAFEECINLRKVFCCTPEAASGVHNIKDLNLFYLGGPLHDLPEECREPAARGFLCAQEQDNTTFDRWRDKYLEYIRDHAGTFVPFAMKNRFYLMLFIKEELLDENGTRQLLDLYENTDDVETKAALLQYQHVNFGTGSTENFSL